MGQTYTFSNHSAIGAGLSDREAYGCVAQIGRSPTRSDPIGRRNIDQSTPWFGVSLYTPISLEWSLK